MSEVKVVFVPKRVTCALLALLMAGMAGLVYALSGRAYAAEGRPLGSLASRLAGPDRVALSTGTVLAYLMPVIANILLFVPWGFLTFVVLDRPGRSRLANYALTFAGAVAFAMAMVAWQRYLPTRVTSVHDALANGLGALAGASLGHVRRSVRVRFEG